MSEVTPHKIEGGRESETRQNSNMPSLLRDLAVKAGVGMTVASITNPYIGAIVALAPDTGKAIYAVLRDFVQRPESPRRSSRALLATECIIKGIAKGLQDGMQIRDDNFFEVGVDRSKAEEVYEAVLDTCIKQYEQRKIPHIAKIYEYAVFHQIPAATVNSLLQQASEKTWRHFCLLCLLSDEVQASSISRFFAVPEAHLDVNSDEPHLRSDLERLHGRATGLISESEGQLRLTVNGRLFVDCANLATINDEEKDLIESTISRVLATRSTATL